MTLYDRINLLTHWMKDVDLKSSDPFALQCNEVAIRLSKLNPTYIGHGISIIDRNFPWFADKFIQYKKAPHSSGLFVQACCLMHQYDNGYNDWKDLATKELIWLKGVANTRYRGFTWGVPFPWLMGNGVLAPENTPMSTVSPYCSDAFYLAAKYLGKDHFLSVGKSVAGFIMTDLNRSYDDGDMVCLSYSPLDKYQIINANAYSAAQLYRAYHYTQNQEYKDLADKMIKFILHEQNEDGSWYYWSRYNRVNEGIDSLHQCYVMQGLIRCWYENQNSEIRAAVLRNLEYTLATFVTNDLFVKKFPEQKHPYELIDAAEFVITCDMVGFSHGSELLDSTIEKFQNGVYFLSRLNPTTNIPFIRWGESQMLYAMVLHLVLERGNITPQEIYL